MAKKAVSKVGQFDHYKKWTTDKGYTFAAETKKDAEEYLKMMGHLGSLKEVKGGLALTNREANG
tara:strand:+ start:378 stop:569 length:192 start_codon:yes stop_codon:yes gene_type:complete